MSTARFATGSPEGPHATVWRLWANRKGDVFIAARAVAGKFKASLHVSGHWRFAATSENARSERSIVGKDRDRAVHKWMRPAEFSPGLTRAFEIWVAGVDVDSPPTPKSSKGDVQWVGPPGPHHFGVFEVMFSSLNFQTNEWPGKETMEAKCVYRARLATGEEIFVLWRTVNATPDLWARRASAVTGQLPPAGVSRELDEPDAMSRLTVGGETNGIGILLDISLTAVASEGLRYAE